LLAASCAFSPLTERQAFSSVRNNSAVAAVIRLLSRGSPTAVLRRVIAVVVDSIDAVTFGRFTHVLKESLEAFPRSAHTDASIRVPLRAVKT
jgi:hypothetical protein